MTVPERRPTWRGWLHTAAFAVAVPAGVLLILAADGPAAVVGAAVYVAGVLLGFGTSASYHRLARSERACRVMQRLDHSMIFVLIAATYTPVCLVLPAAWGIPVLAAVWVGAATGVVLKQCAIGRLRVLEYALYPVLGWMALIAAPALVDTLSGAQIALLVAGGVLYTVGIPVLLVGRPDPWPRTFGYHEVWHAFTVAAATCHFVLVGSVVA